LQILVELAERREIARLAEDAKNTGNGIVGDGSLKQQITIYECITAREHSFKRTETERGYRYVHFEAGAIGQRMYLAAEALGLRATGIGAFFDERVNRYLNLSPEQGQVVYHFAIGYPVSDPRLEG
jgi:nitroreductase